jgi:plasmid maintenance system killer protein
MIISYKGRRTRAFAEGQPVRSFSGISRQAEMKLEQLNAAPGPVEVEIVDYH